jgi:hypothetical protein
LAALLIAGWLLVFADDSLICYPAPAMREWLQSEGYAFEHHHAGLDGRKYEFWANSSDSRAILVEFPVDGPACVADEGFLYRNNGMNDPYPPPHDPHHGGYT